MIKNVTGAIWAERAWGRYWSWDPKETWSLVTWIIYAAYLHLRLRRGWEGRAAAMRYTEARLHKFTQEVFLKDLERLFLPLLYDPGRRRGMGKTTGFLEYERMVGPVRCEPERVKDFFEFHAQLPQNRQQEQWRGSCTTGF